MNRIPVLSIVIPVYNGESYIKRCYKSLSDQLYSDWEAIFVNDGSKDNSLRILKQLRESDSRVIVIDKPNSGAAKSREEALSHCNGEWITFLDVDDWVDYDGINSLMQLTNNPYVDIIMAGKVLVGQGKDSYIRYKDERLTFGETLKRVATQKIRWSLAGNIYRRTLFNNKITTLPVKAGEDMIVFMQLASFSRIILSTSNTFYIYSQEPTSASHRKGIPYLEDAINAALSLKKILEGRYDASQEQYLDAIILLNLSVCIRYRLPLSNAWVKMAIKEAFNMNALTNLPFVKKVLVFVYSSLSQLA